MHEDNSKAHLFTFLDRHPPPIQPKPLQHTQRKPRMHQRCPTTEHHLLCTNRMLVLMDPTSVEPEERPHLCYGGVGGAETGDSVDGGCGGGCVEGGRGGLGYYVAVG